jgi:hypothetical protein
MIKYRDISIPNGDRMVGYRIYKCSGCDEDVEESYPHYIDEELIYCIDCAYRNKKFSEKEYLRYSGVLLDNSRVLISPSNQVIVCIGRAPWERSNKDDRNTLKYKEWRSKVFERDDFTCKKCGQRGGVLNAHHIKSFAKHKNLRTIVENGITLCKKCHKTLHKEGKNE